MTSKLNTVQNGKGPKIRKGADLRKYWEADYWKNKEKKTKEDEKISSECASPELVSTNS